MNALLLARLLALPAVAAPAAPQPGPLDAVERLYESSRYKDVIARLEGAGTQKLRGRHKPRAYELLGESYKRLGELDKAIGIYQLASGLYPKDLNLLTHLANLLRQAELDDRARPLYERILDIHPNNAVAHLGMAAIYQRTGLLARASAHYERCLKEWPDNPAVWRGYAEVLAERRDFRGATGALEKALALDPDNADSLVSLARFQQSQGLDDLAYKTIDRVKYATVQKHHSGLRTRLILLQGLWLLRDGLLNDCAAQAEAVLADDPEDPLGLWLRGSVALRRGKEREAAAALGAAAAKRRRAPFVAAVAEAMLKDLAEQP